MKIGVECGICFFRLLLLPFAFHPYTISHRCADAVSVNTIQQSHTRWYHLECVFTPTNFRFLSNLINGALSSTIQMISVLNENESLSERTCRASILQYTFISKNSIESVKHSLHANELNCMRSIYSCWNFAKQNQKKKYQRSKLQFFIGTLFTKNCWKRIPKSKHKFKWKKSRDWAQKKWCQWKQSDQYF